MLKKVLIGLLCSFFVLVVVVYFKFTDIKYVFKKNPICKNCNIVLISLDTLGAKHLPCYGYSKNTAPNLCQFAKENILFENAYAQSYWTTPSQTSVFTSLYPTTHGQNTAIRSELNPKFITLPQLLQKNGYQTVYLAPDPDTNESFNPNLERGFDLNFKKEYLFNSLSHWKKGLEILSNNEKTNKPTFLYLHTYSVHDPYITQIKDKYQITNKVQIEKEKIPVTLNDYLKFEPQIYDYVLFSLKERLIKSDTDESRIRLEKMINSLEKANTLEQKAKALNTFETKEIYSYLHSWYQTKFYTNDPNQAKFLASLYDETIYNLDQELKGIFDYINSDEKIKKNTIIIIYGDHGEEFLEHDDYGHCYNTFGEKGCLYNEVTKVPLIISIPEIKAKTIKNVTQLIDIYPTLSRLLGIETPNYLEGNDISEIIKGVPFAKKPSYAISEQNYYSKILVDNKFKKLFIYNVDGQCFLEYYDLKKDPNETNNLAQKYPTEVARKLKILQDTRNIKEPNSPLKIPLWVDPIKRERLIKGGYF